MVDFFREQAEAFQRIALLDHRGPSHNYFLEKAAPVHVLQIWDPRAFGLLKSPYECLAPLKVVARPVFPPLSKFKSSPDDQKFLKSLDAIHTVLERKVTFPLEAFFDSVAKNNAASFNISRS